MSMTAFSQLQLPKATVTIALEPVYSNLMSLALLTADTAALDVEPWLLETAAHLTKEQLHHNRLVFEGLGEAVLPTAEYADFPTYLAALEAQSPTALRDRILQRLLASLPGESARTDITPLMSNLLTDAPLFLAYVDRCYPDAARDKALQQEVHQLLNNPPALHFLITHHLRTLWENIFAAEWQRQLQNLTSLVHILNQKQWSAAPAGDAIRAFIQRELPDAISVQLAGIEQVIFVPSPYIRLYANRFGSATKLWVFVLANFWMLPTRTEPIQRSELLGPLQSLADETRLHILTLLAAHGELRAQELIARLDVSQPTVSRHLKELRAARFITEQRGGDANKSYQFHPETLETFCRTLTRLLSVENAQAVLADVRTGQPAPLRRFLDRQGRLTAWPAKQKDQQTVLAYLITKFTPEQMYSEAQVNQLLAEWHTDGDPAYLRRALIDAHLLKRTENGARYWRAG